MSLDPPKVETYECAQPSLDILPRIPLRMILSGPSGSGKTVLLLTLLTKLLRKANGDSVFSRIYVWSPTVFVDPAWEPVREFIHGKMKVPKDEVWAYDSYDPESMQAVITQQTKVIDAAKKRDVRKMFSILVVVDDFADQPAMVRSDKLLWSLFCRGRHAFISTIVSTQKYKALSPIIRCNATALVVFRPRSATELDAIVDELSGLYPRDVVLAMIRHATEEKYSFLYANLSAHDRKDIFWLRFEKRLVAAVADE